MGKGETLKNKGWRGCVDRVLNHAFLKDPRLNYIFAAVFLVLGHVSLAQEKGWDIYDLFRLDWWLYPFARATYESKKKNDG